MNKYYKTLKPLIEKTLKNEAKNLDKTAKLLVATLKSDGLIYVFGSGHSHMLSEEMFYRAGGLANVYPILIEPLMLHQGAVESSRLEAEFNYVNKYLKNIKITKKDVLIVVSNSGRNSTPIDAALWAKKANAKVIVLTSKAYAKMSAPTHPIKKYLYQVGDVVIDNNLPAGDALLTNPKLNVKFAPGSTPLNIILIQTVIENAIELSLKLGMTPPIFKSGNIPGGKEYNQSLFLKYGKRVPFLK
jgi:uncharacterized phosphosugar-binding protein